jgi:ABC-2 type transport system ATP-binding protein
LKQSLESHHILHLESSDVLGSMTALAGKPGILDIAVFGGGLHLTVQDPAWAIPQIRSLLDAQKISIRQIEPIQPSMEDVFVAMIEQEERKLS